MATLLFVCSGSCAKQQFPSSPFAPLETDWPAIPAGQSVLERISGVEGKMLQYLQAMDNNQRYATHQITDAERQLLAVWIARLPPAHRQLMDSRLVAIALVDGFKGSGMTDFLRMGDSKAYPQRFILFVNADILGKTMSERLSERDGSVFKPAKDGGRLKVTASLSDGGEPPAIWFLLMHEASHLYDYVKHVTPKIESNLPDDGDARGKSAERPFTRDIWLDADHAAAQADFSLRSQLRFYGLQEPRLEFSQAGELFDQLLSSPFASIYGSQSWAEDWAELSTWYQFTRAGGKLRIQLVDKGGTVEKTWLPLDNPRVQARFKQAEAAGFAGF